MGLIKKYKYYIALTVAIIVVISYYIFNKNKESPYKSEYTETEILIDSLLTYDLKSSEILIGKYFKNATENEENLGKAYFYKASLLVRKNKLDSVSYFLDTAKIYAVKNNDRLLEARLTSLNGFYFLFKDNYPNSMENLFSALSFFKSNYDNSNYLADVYSGLGGLYYYGLKEEGKAISFYKKAYKIYDINNNSRGKAIVYGNFGNMFLHKKSYVEAKENLRKSYQIFEELGDTANLIRILIFLSALELELNQVSESLGYLDKASELAVLENDHALIGIALLNYGYVYESLNNYDKAVEYYEEAYNHTINSNQYFPIEHLNTLKRFSELLRKTKKYEESLNYLDKYYTMKDSLNGVKVRQRVEELEWGNILKENLLEYEISKQKYKNHIKTYLIIIISVLSSIVFIYLLYRSNKKTLKISKLENVYLLENIKKEEELNKIREEKHLAEIESKNKELMGINVQLLFKNRLLNEIENIVKDKSKNIYSEIEKSIKQNRNSEKDWEQFEQVFEKIHPSFFKHIQDNYSILTKTEKRICAYIKINMSNHEIASLLNVDYLSIIKSRYRIRKKLKLKNEEDLDEIIHSL
ncbi:tetratricopeptide repeat protein [Myroides indicus]|uniref:Tetratricopeptide repeat protein n=1 Tax=Myroides indicus TaxID=1323422 RepID=A0A4R7EMB9_9FLAO|nr:tetratricopeptide repeat protein [Myroides indicus]TDS50960.1 tetratricopeptide repeat protein [Myroides indicus]